MAILLLETGDDLLLETGDGSIELQAQSVSAVGMGIKAMPASAFGPSSLLECEDFPPFELENGDDLLVEDDSGNLSLQSRGELLFLESGLGGLLVEQSNIVAPKTTVAVRMTNRGSGYTSAPTVTIPGVTARAVLGTRTEAGTITGVVITAITGSPADPLTVTFSGGGGSGAAAIARTISIASQVSTSDPPFQVRGEYGAVLIDSVQDELAGGGPGTLQPPGLQEPPLPQPVFDPETMMAKSLEELVAQLQRGMHARAWSAWFQELRRVVLTNAPGNGAELQFACPSIDETDIGWYAKLTESMDDTTDPVTIGIEMKGESRFGIQLAIVSRGTGYVSTDPPTVMISGVGATGTGATANPVINDATGELVAIEVVSSGFGYVGPLSVSITGGSGSGALAIGSIGRQWAVGDYVLFNDPTIPPGAELRSYEIMKILAIEDSSVTFERRPPGAPAGQSQYGSITREHASGIPFYRLINKVFSAKQVAARGPQPYIFPWPNMTVPAITALIPGKDPITLNFTPRVYIPATDPPQLDPRTFPPSPGFRTMNGAGYISMGVIGDLAVGQTAVARIVGVQAPESIRCVYMRTRTAPVGPVTFGDDDAACIVAYVVYISPAGQAYLIDTLVIDDGQLSSYGDGNVPDGRMMPYHVYFPATAPFYDWPPNRLPLITAPAFNAAGGLVKPLLPADVDPATTALYSPDGQIDFIIAQVGSSTPGTDLIFAVQS